MPKVLISDALSPAAVQIFKDRGVEVDVKPGLPKDELLAIIGQTARLSFHAVVSRTTDANVLHSHTSMAPLNSTWP